MFGLIRIRLPAQWPQVFDFHIKERQECCTAERASAVEVGVISRPACHDLLIIHQTLTRLTERAAGHLHLHTAAGRQRNGFRILLQRTEEWGCFVWFTYLYRVTGRGLEATDVRGGVWSVRSFRSKCQTPWIWWKINFNHRGTHLKFRLVSVSGNQWQQQF